MSAERWRELGQQLRVDSVRASAAAGSGHPTSSMSAADLLAVLLDGGFLRLDTPSGSEAVAAAAIAPDGACTGSPGAGALRITASRHGPL